MYTYVTLLTPYLKYMTAWKINHTGLGTLKLKTAKKAVIVHTHY